MIIIQQNINKNNNCIKELMDTLLTKDPDIIFFIEFCYANHEKEILKRLENGYQIFLPWGFEDKDKKNSNINAACMLAVKKEYTFEQKQRASVCQKYRYIEGSIIKRDSKERIECFFAYVQQLFIERKYNYSNNDIDRYLRLAEKKANMLFEIYRFSEENKEKEFFIGGDLNTDIEENNSQMISIFKTLYDNIVDTYKYETWSNKHLDYALISKVLNKEYTCRTTPIKTNSDHLALCTEIIPPKA